MASCDQAQRTGFFFTRESASASGLTAILSPCIAQFTVQLTCHSQPFSGHVQLVSASARGRAQQVLILMWPGSKVTTTLGRLELSWILEHQKLLSR